MNNRYEMTENCFIDEIDGYGYAFVPGSSFGVVLLDLRTKQLLENISSYNGELDQTRINLLLAKGLIRRHEDAVKTLVFDRKATKSIDTWLHVANTCNLACPYCYIVNKQLNELMSVSVAKQYLDKLEQTVQQHELKSVSIRFAGGEPTLNKNIVCYVINEAKGRFLKEGISVKFALITNGTLLNQEWIKLISSESIELSISLDGIGDWHNRSRFFINRQGSFDIVMKNINLCREQGINPNILTTATEDNLEGLPSLFNCLVDGNFSFRLGIFRDNVGDYRGYSDFTNRLKNILDGCYAFYADSIRVNGKVFHHQFSDIHFNKQPHLRCCGVGRSTVTVNHAGKVFLCQAEMDKESIGDICEDKTLLEMAWSQLNFPELQDKTVLDYESCCECQWALICGGGCHIVKKNATGLVTKASPYCDLFKFVIPKIIELKTLHLVSNLKKGGRHGTGNFGSV